MPENDRNKRRIFVTFTEEQIRLIEGGVSSGFGLNKAEYIRRAVDNLNEKVLELIEVEKLREENVELKRKIKEFQEK